MIKIVLADIIAGPYQPFDIFCSASRKLTREKIVRKNSNKIFNLKF